jgi:hypothetical protein
MSPRQDCQVNGLSLGYEPEPNRALRLKGAPEVGGLSPHRSRCGTTQAVPIQSAAAAALARDSLWRQGRPPGDTN